MGHPPKLHPARSFITPLSDIASLPCLHDIRRISIVYDHPYFKIGEALPRIAMMAPQRLMRIDYCPQLNIPFHNFRFHPSLPVLLKPLRDVRILCLGRVFFMHRVELRKLLACFPGIQLAIVKVELQYWRRIQDDTLSYRLANPLLQRVIHLHSSHQHLPIVLLAIIWLKSHKSRTNEQVTSFVAPSIDSNVVKLVEILYIVLFYERMHGKGERVTRWAWDNGAGRGSRCTYISCSFIIS